MLIQIEMMLCELICSRFVWRIVFGEQQLKAILKGCRL